MKEQSKSDDGNRFLLAMGAGLATAALVRYVAGTNFWPHLVDPIVFIIVMAWPSRSAEPRTGEGEPSVQSAEAGSSENGR